MLGAESTGTRLATKILIEAGCTGWDGHFQPFDKEPIGDQDPIVWRRSVPHNGTWLALGELLARLYDRDVHVIITMRDWTCAMSSQVRNKHAKTRVEALEKLRKAYREIFEQVNALQLPYTVLVYESMILNPDVALKAFVRELGLNPNIVAPTVTNENLKYFGELL